MTVYMVTLNISLKDTYIGKWSTISNVFTTREKAKVYLNKHTDELTPLVIHEIELDKE